MDQLRTKRGFVRTAITKTISTLSTLLEDPATPIGTLEHHLAVLEQKYSELVAFDDDIQATLFNTDLEADMATSFDYQQKVIFAISDVRRATQSRLPILSVCTANTARPFVAPLASSPQHAPIFASPGLSTPAPTLPCVVKPAVPRHADVTSHASDALPEKLQPAQLCEVPPNSTTFIQPAVLTSKDNAVLSNTCATSTVQLPTPVIISRVHAAKASAATPSPALSSRKAHFFNSSAHCSQSSKPTFAAMASKVKKDGEKRPHTSSGSSKYYCSRSHFRNGKGPTSSVSGKGRTMPETSCYKKRRNIRKRHKNGKLYGSKTPSISKGRQKYRRPPEELRLSRNVITTFTSLPLGQPPAPQDKPPPAATPPVATPSITAQQAPHEFPGQHKNFLCLHSPDKAATKLSRRLQDDTLRGRLRPVIWTVLCDGTSP